MTTDVSNEWPLKHLISFEKLLKRYEAMAEGDDAFLAEKAKRILEAQAPYPILKEGFTDVALLEEHKDVISIILEDAFSEVLSENEIKAASLPYRDVIFNATDRFKKILKDAGKDFVPVLTKEDVSLDYIMNCVVILKFHYGYKLDFHRPYFYKIPNKDGVIHYYRVLYNADFIDLYPTELAKDLSQDDIDELLENPNDLKLWKEKIPPNSFISKGFVIANMFDATAEQAISEIKSELIASNKRGSDKFMSDLQETFKSFFRLKDLQVGFSTYNREDDQFERVFGKGMHSFMLNESDFETCDEALCQYSYEKLLKQNAYFIISDVQKYFDRSGGMQPYKNLKDQGISSVIFAPIALEGQLLGVLEIVSKVKNQFNGVNARKLNDVMPFIVSAVVRSKNEQENLIDAVIQKECTTIHSAVYWKFRKEAKRFINENLRGKDPSFQEIVFNEVYPLYGQTDIQSSSDARNESIQRDLMIQLSEINIILQAAFKEDSLPVYEELIFRVKKHIEEVSEVLQTNTEQSIYNFVKTEIDPVLLYLKEHRKDLGELIATYESRIDESTDTYYDHRKNYDTTVMKTNRQLAAILDEAQKNAQEMFPHYFERYKTDGVEHNLYIGGEIAEDRKFDFLYLNNLRLWQLQVMCEMENSYYNLKPLLPVQLDVASLILVYHSSLSIRFRMDEKHFDVDGTYNARYEVIKKRIDKSYIKGTNRRLTEKGKIAIVYSEKSDELEYLRYISFLKSKGYFTNNIEIVDLEGLQGVTGLKAIRAEILYNKQEEPQKTYTYEDLMEALKE
ncbi:GAF domain-containing protein [Muriicola soli]|uniref:GAF domain-containing protein n=1 Tax=Muriicola soli TaxID=2507538 RepID=A0A411EC09_9FLAO|nr:GAF domain-containing protein [Muriicola soli]QBA65073.1 GAF domain-containing protein [Muriicola soli]